MKKLYTEIAGGVAFVLAGTYFTYNLLAGYTDFWNAQNLWTLVLLFCWAIVAVGYWHQGRKISLERNSSQLSLWLPSAVFVVQCALFVKGIYYNDSGLIIGALVVNSAVVFVIFEILKYKGKSKK